MIDFIIAVSSKKYTFFSKYEGHTEGIKSLAFTPDGEYFASGCLGGVVKLWKANPPFLKCQTLIENVHDLGVMSCDFSHNYKTLPGILIIIDFVFTFMFLVEIVQSKI